MTDNTDNVTQIGDDNSYKLSKDCPVQPLGMNDGVYFYLDANKQIRKLPAGKHRGTEIFALFGKNAEQYLHENYPRYSKPDDKGKMVVNGWKSEVVGMHLMEACAVEGLIDLNDTVRGAGCWRNGNNLIMHCGDAVFCGNEILQPQKIGQYIYPAEAPKPHPSENISDIDAAQELLELFKTWNWARPDIDPYLLLGWIGAAIIGGALDWRPMVWITGDKGTGKSTLQKIITSILGRGIITANDAYAAGIWQSLGHTSLPVALDEIEAEEDNRKNSNLIKLVRCAASGGQTLRGGSDHKQSSFTVRSCFLFSSILIPPMLGQDVSRMARLELRKLDKGESPLHLDDKRLEQIGTIFRRRVLDQWSRFIDTLGSYRNMLHSAGHGGRGQDQFGTLLACHNILLYDTQPHSDHLDKWAELMNVSMLNETADDSADWELCIEYLLSSFIEPYRTGSKKTIAYWVSEAAGYKHGDASGANDALILYGIKVFKKDDVLYLRIANSHRALAKIFEGSQWAGRAGASGVWAQSLRRIEGSKNLSGIYFNGVRNQCVQIPLDQIISSKGDDYG